MKPNCCLLCRSTSKSILEPYVWFFDNPGYARMRSECNPEHYYKWHGQLWKNTELVGSYYRSKDKEIEVKIRGKPF